MTKVIQLNGAVEIPGVVRIETPSVPNFVTVNGQSTSVTDLTDDQVEAICIGWANKFKSHVASKKSVHR